MRDSFCDRVCWTIGRFAARTMAAAILCVLSGIVASSMAAAQTPKAVEYRIEAGDTLEVSVYGAQDLRRKSAVDIDGRIAFPLLGNVAVAGRTIAEARVMLAELIVEKGLLSTPDVTVEIVEYRPFFINGDVSKPGSYPYRPGTTVRHAIALAGGLDALRSKTNINPLVETAELNGQSMVLRAELAQEQVRIQRLEAEARRSDKVEFTGFIEKPVAAQFYKDIVEAESRQLRIRMAGVDLDRSSVVRSMQHVQAQIDALEQQRKGEEEGLAKQDEDFTKVRELYNKGLAPLSRMLDEQRSIMMSKSRHFSTVAQLFGARRVVEDLRRRSEKTDEEHQLQVTKELQDARLSVQRIQARLQAVNEKMHYLNVAERVYTADVHRRSQGKQTTFSATEATELQPGDVVDIVVPRNGSAAVR